MNCTECNAELDETSVKCPSCGSQVTHEPDAQYVEWITVLADRDYGRTGLAESLLQSEGIEYITEGLNTRWAELNEPVRVCVHPQDVDRARETLNELLEGNASG